MDYAALARESLDRVAASKPLIHQITNVVVTNDSANLTLAFGALPVMAYAPQEVAEMAGISQALVLNIGTLSEEEIDAMLLAGTAAGEPKASRSCSTRSAPGPPRSVPRARCACCASCRSPCCAATAARSARWSAPARCAASRPPARRIRARSPRPRAMPSA